MMVKRSIPDIRALPVREAADADEAVTKAAAEYKVPAAKLIAVRR